MKSADWKRKFPPYTIALLGLWLVLTAACFSDAATDVFVAIAWFGLSDLWGLIWVIRLIVTLVRERRGAQPKPAPRDRWLYWGFEPAVLFLGALLAASGLFFQVRFFLSRPALQAYAADITAGRKEPHGFDSPKRWVGLFRVAETECLPDGVVRLITSHDFLDDAGLTFSPATSPPHIGEDTYRGLSAGWYYWHRSW